MIGDVILNYLEDTFIRGADGQTDIQIYANVETAVNSMSMCLDCGRKPGGTTRIHEFHRKAQRVHNLNPFAFLQ